MKAMENAYGLLVGIANYRYINPLPETVLHDVQAIHSVLTDPRYCAYPKKNVTSLIDGKATRKNLRKALVKLSRCNKDSTVFIYISSHGGRIQSGPNAGEYLLPVDTRFSSDKELADTAIAGNEFTTALQSIPARKVVVVFDCCHAGGIGDPKSAVSSKFINISESYYDTLASGVGRVILAASRSNERAYVFPTDSNSVFTLHLLAGLRGGVPGPGGVIRILHLFDYLQPRVTKRCPDQHPVLKVMLEENFPVALCLGGKAPDATIDAASNGLVTALPEKTGRIMRQIDCLLGIEQKLSEHQYSTLCTTLAAVNGENASPGKPPAKLSEEAAEVIKEAEREAKPEADKKSGKNKPLYRFPHTELLSALLRIGCRLGLDRLAMDGAPRSNYSSWKVEDWLRYLTDKIICEQGVVRHHLIAPSPAWIEPLFGATAVALESLWQQVRLVLTQNKMSFAVARPGFEIHNDLESLPAGGLNKLAEAAKKALQGWPAFPHLGAEKLPALEELLPLPQSSIRSAVLFKGPNGCPIRLCVGESIVAESEAEDDRIEYWPPNEGSVEYVLECDEGAGFRPHVYARLQRLYAMEASVLDTAGPDLYQGLHLKNDLLQELWPKILAGAASREELAQTLHLLRDAWESYEKVFVEEGKYQKRRDTYWDAVELVRKIMLEEKKV